MDSLLHDLRFALGSIRRKPLLSLAIVITLGLGLGANAAIFRAFSGTFLRPLPFADEERLVRLVLLSGSTGSRISPRADVFLAVREHARSFASTAGQRFNDLTLVTGGDPERVSGIEVSEGWAGTVGVEPYIGRVFTDGEERQGAGSGVALISHRAWRAHFGGDHAAVGGTARLNGRSFTIIGVMPPGFNFPYEAEFWIPARFDDQLEGTWALNIVARLRPGVSHAEMSAELAELSARLEEVRSQRGMTLLAIPIRQVLIDDEARPLQSIFVAVGFLLILVTVNIAHLLAAHSLSRRREYAIRTALGAGIRRHLQQTMTEGLLLAFLGGIAALLLAQLSTSLLAVLVPSNFSYVTDELPFDWRVGVFTMLLGFVIGIVLGAIPLIRIAGVNLLASLHQGERSTESRSNRRSASIIAAVEIALASMLVAGAIAMVRDFRERSSVDLGYDSTNLMTITVALPAERYPVGLDRKRFFDALLERVGSIPGVESTGTVNLFPAAGQGALLARIEEEGREYREEEPMLVHNRLVNGPLLQTMHLRLLSGRLMTDSELVRGDPVAVVSRSLASALTPAGSPIGRRIRDRRQNDSPWVRIVGVVDDLHEFYADTSRAMYQPMSLYAHLPATAQAVVVTRSKIESANLVSSVRDAISSIDPALAAFDAASAEDLYRQSLAGRRSAGTLSGAFGMIALLIAAIGIYGSMAFSMARRVREISVRMALGATRAAIFRHFAARSAVVASAGVIIGIASSLLLGRLLTSVLGEIPPMHSAYLISSAAILLFTALAASAIPLRRAVRADPATVLRAE